MNLQLATNEQLIQELRSRYFASVILGVRRECHEELDVLIDGPGYMVKGLMQETLDGIATYQMEMEEE